MWEKNGGEQLDIWEYKVQVLTIPDMDKFQRELNQLGAEGWELCTMLGDRRAAPRPKRAGFQFEESKALCIFKRKKS